MAVTNISMSLSHLPIRPSTLARLQQRGFLSTKELDDSKRRGGMINVAHELGVDIHEAANLVREVERAMLRIHGSDDDADDQAMMDHANVDGAGITMTGGRTLRTAAELYLQYHHNHGNKQHNRSIITVCRSIDRLMGDGLPRAEVTEVVGMPGVGKTQLAMQLSVTTRLLASYGGVEGQVLYLDTEGSFSPERCYTMAHALVHHVQATFERRRQQYLSQVSHPSYHHPQQQQPSASASSSSSDRYKAPPPLPEWWTPEYILQGIHVYRIHDEAALQATLHALPQFIKEQEKQGHWPVRLVILDSIAFPYRCAPAGSDYLARTRSLTTVATMLADMSQKHNLAFLVTNHMTTQIVQGQSRVVPALGESWAHAVTNRLLISIPQEQPALVPIDDTDGDGDGGTNSVVGSIRKCSLIKSPHKPNGDAYFQVLEIGVRDAPLAVHDPNRRSEHNETSDAASKRLRAPY